MDLEEDIRSLQLDSAEDVNENINGGTELELDTIEEDAPEVVHASLQINQAEQKLKDAELEIVKEIRRKRHLYCVFIGHVEAGKYRTVGQILFLSAEADVGRAHFETVNTSFTILDAPDHDSYAPNMAARADIGVLVISAHRGEFETGFERDGQTRKHIQLAKTGGVSKIIVAVNKMDDPTVNWSQGRYAEIKSKMVPFLKSSGYNVKKDVQFLPISGLVGSNIAKRMEQRLCPWWRGPCLFEALDVIEVPARDPNGPFRMPIIDKSKDMGTVGTVVMGKVECGSVSEGDSLLVMPNKALVKVTAVYCDENKVRSAGPGENVRVRMSGIEEEDILSGFVLCSVPKPIATVTEFVAQLQILELHNTVFTAGYKAVLHIHAAVEECECLELIQQIEPKTRKPVKRKIMFAKNDAVVVCRLQVNNLICIEKYSDFPQLGRFTLRTGGNTIAVGQVTDLHASGTA